MDLECRNKWIAAVNRQSWICSKHLVSGVKSNNPLVPNYMPSLFKYTKSPVKRHLEARNEGFARRQAIKRRRVEESQRFEKVKEEKERM